MATATEQSVGQVTQIIGSTFDAEFPEDKLPEIYRAGTTLNIWLEREAAAAQ